MMFDIHDFYARIYPILAYLGIENNLYKFNKFAKMYFVRLKI